jgi:anti-sigma factor RsiW
MTDKLCTYGSNRDETLIAYVYDDIDGSTRAEFEAHLAACQRCRDDIEAFRGVRATLSHWYPPEPNLRSAARPPAVRDPQWWRQIPAWAQVAAALLVLGVSAGFANLDIRHDANGFTIRTGWSKPAAVAASQNTAKDSSMANAVSKADLLALEQRLRAEARDARAAQVSTMASNAARPASADAELLRKVRALVDESERREQRELALRVAQLITDVNAQRVADLRKIDIRLLGVQNNLGVEVLKQQQSLNYLATRVSQRQ